MAGGLPHVIVETTDEQTSRYLTGLAQQQDTVWAYQHPDGLGTVRHLSNASAEVTLLQSYDPFGNPVEQSGPGASGFGYTGEQEDANTGLVFLRARYYDPSVGRFLTEDPKPGIAYLPQSLNIYTYAWNNPILRVDPSGLQPPPPECNDPGQICYTGTVGTQVLRPISGIAAPQDPRATVCPDESRCKIEVFSVPVGGTPLGRHLFIVHTDEKGVEKTIQGLPERVPPNVAQEFFDHQDHDRTAPPEASPWRRLVFKSEIGFDPNGTQSRYHPALRGPANIKEGKETCLLYRCLENAANAILNANLSYWPHDQNSNAFAATILKKCFLPRKRPFGIHPGWSLEDLIAPGVGR